MILCSLDGFIFVAFSELAVVSCIFKEFLFSLLNILKMILGFKKQVNVGDVWQFERFWFWNKQFFTVFFVRNFISQKTIIKKISSVSGCLAVLKTVQKHVIECNFHKFSKIHRSYNYRSNDHRPLTMLLTNPIIKFKRLDTLKGWSISLYRTNPS